MQAERHAIGNDIAIDAGKPAHQRDLADAAELLRRRQAADDHAVADLHMAAQLHGVGEGDVIADDAVVADMAGRHQIVPVADRGHAAARVAAGRCMVTISRMT